MLTNLRKNILNFFHGRKPGNVSLLLGNWELGDVTEDGFVLRNTREKEEWHIASQSNGWITGINRTNKLNPTVLVTNTKGFTGYAPFLVDKESVELRKLSQNRVQKVG